MDLSVKLVKITGGRFSLGKAGGHARPLVLENVNIEVRDFSAGSAFPFTFDTKVAGGGSIKLDGKAGPLDAVDVAASPLTATFSVDKLDLAGSGLLQSAPAIAGLIGFQAALQSDGKTAHIQGKMKAENLKLAKDGERRQAPGGIRFHAGPQSAQPVGATAPGRDQDWQRGGQPYGQLCRRGRNHRAQDEPGRSREWPCPNWPRCCRRWGSCCPTARRSKAGRPA